MAALRWRHLNIVMVGLVAAVAIGLILNDSPTLCANVEQLLRESSSEFDGVRGELTDPSAGEWSTSFAIDGASSCSIIVDPERASHVCSWEYSAASGAGPVEYRERLIGSGRA